MNREFDNLNDLIKNNLNNPETAKAEKLFDSFKDVKTKGFFTKQQFYEVAMWKTPRPKNHYLSNSKEHIKDISKRVLSTDSEDVKIALLTSLHGVSIAVASSLLTMIDPKNYGIIDIRVWQLLYLYGGVKTKPSGRGFNLNDWKIYLAILRKYASQLNMNVRNVERILFFYHRKAQVGSLYPR
jgi:thermostable 8-oxoguanine DNA glycosylase